MTDLSLMIEEDITRWPEDDSPENWVDGVADEHFTSEGDDAQSV